MRKLLKTTIRLPGADESGFSLMELLVAIGIMVAIAAITVPLVTRFASSGKSGAKTAEQDTIQTALDTYIADNSLNVLPSGDVPSNVTSNFASGGTLDLSTYLRKATTTYFYCWDNKGGVSKQEESSGAAC